MEKIKIEEVVFIGDRLLMVYHSPRHCYQYMRRNAELVLKHTASHIRM